MRIEIVPCFDITGRLEKQELSYRVLVNGRDAGFITEGDDPYETTFYISDTSGKYINLYSSFSEALRELVER